MRAAQERWAQLYHHFPAKVHKGGLQREEALQVTGRCGCIKVPRNYNMVPLVRPWLPAQRGSRPAKHLYKWPHDVGVLHFQVYIEHVKGRGGGC